MWTLPFLVEQLAAAVPGVDPVALVQDWLASWERAQLINGWGVPAATPDTSNPIRSAWDVFSRRMGATGLVLDALPFRLLAIVNRIDLMRAESPPGYAGEVRFVFAAIDEAGTPLEFLLILEYGIYRRDAPDVLSWARQWDELGQWPLGSAKFNDALQALTDQVARAETDAGGGPLRSALNRIRTNERVFSPATAGRWQLREFLLASTGYLQQVAVAQTPAASYNGSARLTQFMMENEVAIHAEQHIVPETYRGQIFRAAVADARSHRFWSAASVSVPLRYDFARLTCDGCHYLETSDTRRPSFTHVKPRFAGVEAELSGFLTGCSMDEPPQRYAINDPWETTESRQLDDLWRRQGFLDALLRNPAAAPYFSLGRGSVH